MALDYPSQQVDPLIDSTWRIYGASRHGHGEGGNASFIDGSARFVADPGNIMETYKQPTNPVSYSTGNGMYYYYVYLLGWTYDQFKQQFPQE